MQSNFEKVYRHIHKDRLTSSKLLLSFIFRFFISTNKSTPCILFTIEDSPLKKKKRKNRKDSFSKIQIRFFDVFLLLTLLPPSSTSRYTISYTTGSFLFPFLSPLFPSHPDIVPEVRYLAGININRLAA